MRKTERGVVQTVDTLNYSCVVITNRRTVTVPIAPIYIGKEGNGMFFMPEVNSSCFVGLTSEGEWIYLGGAPVVSEKMDYEESDDPDADPEEMEEDASPSYRMSRPIINTGDIVLSSKGGNFCILRNGGVVEIGGNSTASRMYIPLNNVIRDLCQSYLLNTSGGDIDWKRREDSATDWGSKEVREDSTDFLTGEVTTENVATPLTATELTVNIREFAENEPVIEMNAGRISIEDDEAVVGGDIGEIIFRFVIKDDDGDAVLNAWADKKGNVQIKSHGQLTTSFEGGSAAAIQHHQGGLFHTIGGLFKRHTHTMDVLVANDNTLVVNKDQRTTIHGKLFTKVDGHVDIAVGDMSSAELPSPEVGKVSAFRVKGGFSMDVGGSTEIECTNNILIDSGGELSLNSMNFDQAIAGEAHITIMSPVPKTVSYAIHNTGPSNTGAIQIHNSAGKVQITSGLKGLLGPGVVPPFPLSLISASPYGAIHLVSTAGVWGQDVFAMELNLTGASIGGQVGGIQIDNAGTVHLGIGYGRATAGNVKIPAPVPVNGAVITTGTMPMCYVTGAPILGCSSVQACGVPITPVGLPSLFVPIPTGPWVPI